MSSKQTRLILACEWAILIAIIMLASTLRYWRITEVPPGFNSDEAVGAVGALTTLREGIRYSYDGQGGGGVLGFYFAAAFFWLFGPSIATIRGLAAWAGVMSILANYWAIREMFRGEGLWRARAIATLSTLGLATALWHVTASRIAFAGIGVPFLMLPSVYFLWRGLNQFASSKADRDAKPDIRSFAQLFSAIKELILNPTRLVANLAQRWTFVVSGLFLGSLMYIYLSGVFAPPLYAAFFIAQWLILWFWWRRKSVAQPKPRSSVEAVAKPTPTTPYLTTQLPNVILTALTSAVLLLPIIYVLLNRPEDEPGVERVSQAFFLNEQINGGDPWGLLWRSFIGNFEAYGVSLRWLWGELPPLAGLMPWPIGLAVFIGFVICLIQALRGKAAYLFSWLWFVILLFPSILAPDAIPHHLRTIGATTPTYIFAAVAVVSLFDLIRWALSRTALGKPIRVAVGVACALGVVLMMGQANRGPFEYYFFVFPETNDAEAAYHIYAVEMADFINAEANPRSAFLLPRNTAAGDVFRNYTTDFLVDLAQPPAAHYWIIDDETTLLSNVITATREHDIIKLINWKTSKHTGADPKEIFRYHIEKFGRYGHISEERFFDVLHYTLDVEAPDFEAAEQLTPTEAEFRDPNSGATIRLLGYGFGDASNVSRVMDPAGQSEGLLWARVRWEMVQNQAQDLKTALIVHTANGQVIAQADKVLLNNLWQKGSSHWPQGAIEDNYFLLDLPAATPPGDYQVSLALYNVETFSRLTPHIADQPLTERERTVPLGPLTIYPAGRPADVDDLNLIVPIKQEVLPALTLLGFENLPDSTVRTGQMVGGTVLWQAGNLSASPDVRMALEIKAGEGEQTWPLGEPVGLAGDHPTTAWQAEDVWRGWLKARIPPELMPGLYKLRLQLWAGADLAATLPIGDFEVAGWARNFTPPAPQLPLAVNFGDQTTLIGLDLSAQQLTAGGTLDVTVHWQAVEPFERDYTAFVHLIGPDGRLYGQIDQTPGSGQFPTTGWVSGEFITDGYRLTIAPDAPSGAYQIEIGLYDPTSGQRLPLNCTAEMCDQVNQRVLLGGFEM